MHKLFTASPQAAVPIEVAAAPITEARRVRRARRPPQRTPRGRRAKRSWRTRAVRAAAAPPAHQSPVWWAGYALTARSFVNGRSCVVPGGQCHANGRHQADGTAWAWPSAAPNGAEPHPTANATPTRGSKPRRDPPKPSLLDRRRQKTMVAWRPPPRPALCRQPRARASPAATSALRSSPGSPRAPPRPARATWHGSAPAPLRAPAPRAPITCRHDRSRYVGAPTKFTSCAAAPRARGGQRRAQYQHCWNLLSQQPLKPPRPNRKSRPRRTKRN